MAEPLLFRWRRLVVIDDRLTAADKHVALTLALHMDTDGGSCFPSVSLLALETSRKRHTVIASVDRLEELDYLRVKRGGIGKSKGPNRYEAKCPKGHLVSAPRGHGKVPQGAHEFFKNSDGGASRKQRAAAVCEECETGGGLHTLDCSRAA